MMIKDDDPHRPNFYRYIAVFDKKPNENGNHPWLTDYEFYKPVSLKFLQNLFNIDPNHPDGGARYMVDSYDIDEYKAKILQPFVKEILDLKKYDFQLECCSSKETFDQSKVQKPYTEDELMRFIVAETPVFVKGAVEKRLTFQKPISVEFLCQLFKCKSNELGWVDIEDKKIAKALEPFLSEPFDFSKYNYTLRCSTKESYEAWKKEDNIP